MTTVDGGANTLAAQNACSCVFSPVSPLFLLTGDNALLLTAFALAFSPVNPLSENDGKTTEFAYAYSVFSP